MDSYLIINNNLMLTIDAMSFTPQKININKINLIQLNNIKLDYNINKINLIQLNNIIN